MEFMFGMIVALAVILIVSLPLFKQEPARQAAWGMGRQMDDLLAEKTTVFAAIRNLEVDYDTGNIPDDEYVATRDHLKSKAVGLLKEIDELKTRPSKRAQQSKRQAVQPAGQRSVPKPAQKESVKIYACPECGKGYVKGDAFCSACGCELK